MTERLGKYELRGVVGSGAAGVVHDAWDPDLARRVAIKQVTLAGRTPAEQEELRARFRQEAQIAGRLAHPGVVAVHDYGEADGAAYLVMAFVDGRSLAARLRDEGKLPIPEAVRIARAILAALGHCHAAGVLHRDIKPGNVLLGRDGSVALTDFGVARTAASDLTAQGTLIGTPAYMAPEQFGGGTPDARTDIYACAVVLYEMLTGRKPFDGDLFAVMHQVQSVAPPPPSSIVALPSALEAVLLRGLAKRQADRFPDAAAFAEALAHSLLPPTRGGWRTPTLAATAAVLLAAGGLGWALWPRPQEGAPLTSATADTSPSAPAAPPAPRGSAGRATPVAPAAPVQDPAVPPAPTQAPALAPSAAPTEAPALVPPAAPIQAPAAAPPASPDPIATLRAGLHGLPCAAVRLVVLPDPPRVVVRGLVGDVSRPLLSARLAGFSSVVEADRVETLAPSDGTCAALALVQAYQDAGAGLDLLEGRGRLHEGDPIRVALHMPDFPGFVRLDYLTEDGRSVVHLDQDRLQALSWPAGARILLGPAGDGVIGAVGAPYGRDLVLVTVSSVPLLPGVRPQQEPAAPYLGALRTAMAKAAAGGAGLAADAERLETAVR